MKTKILAACGLLLLSLSCGQGAFAQDAGAAAPAQKEQKTADKRNVIDEVAWIVGDEPILRSDIERQRLYYESMGQRFQGDARCIIPEQMAVQKLFLNQAEIDSVYPEERIISQEVNRWLQQVTNELGGREKVEEYLGQSYAKIREERRKVVAEEITVMQMQQKLVGEVNVAPSEVTRFYQEIDKDSLPFMPETVEVQIITADPKISVAEIDRVKERLISFTKQINDGTYDFATLARLYSQDNETAAKGGELGFLGRAELEPEFANVAFSLRDPSKVSRIVQTKKGYHILQLIEKRDELINVRHIMLRPEVELSELEKATARLDSISAKILSDSLTFGQAAMYFSFDEETRLSDGQMVNANSQSRNYGTARFELSELPQEVSAEVSSLEVGELTKPFRMYDKDNNEVVAIARLQAKHPGHRANVVEDYQTIKEMVEGRKRGEMIEEWVKEKQKTTFVNISPGYRDCDFRYPNWVER